MKFFLFAVIFCGLAGFHGCVKPSQARAEPEKIAPPSVTESMSLKPSSGEYLQNTMDEAREFVLTEDPRVWMRAVQGGF